MGMHPQRIKRGVCLLFGSAQVGISEPAQRHGAIADNFLAFDKDECACLMAADMGTAWQAAVELQARQVFSAWIDSITANEIGGLAAVGAIDDGFSCQRDALKAAMPPRLWTTATTASTVAAISQAENTPREVHS